MSKKQVRQILIDGLQNLQSAKTADDIAEVAHYAGVDLLEYRDAHAQPETRAGKMLRISEILRAIVHEMDGMGSDVPVIHVADSAERYGKYVDADQILAAIGCMLALEAEPAEREKPGSPSK